MNILVTGGAGYIGSLLVPELLKKEHRVTVVDNFMYNQTSLLDVCHDKNLEIIHGDVRDKRVIKESLRHVEMIIPLACITGIPICEKQPKEAKSINLGAILMMLKLRHKNQMIIFPTTNSGYGLGEKSKICTEETPMRPRSIYGKTKQAAETAILESGNSLTLRLTTAFGTSPRMRFDVMVNDFVYRAVRDKYIVLFEAGFKRNFVHVRDMVRAFMHVLKNFEKMKNEPYNVGLSGVYLNKRELCGEIKKQIPDFYFTESEIGRDPDKRDYIISNEKIEKTGFKAKIGLAEGIVELVKGYKIINS